MGPAVSPAFVPYVSPDVPTSANARLLNLDGDYEQSATGLVPSASPVDQEAVWRIRTIKGSFVGDVNLGNGVVFIKNWTNSSVVDIRDAVMLALTPMLDRGVIENVIVTADPYVNAGTSTAAYSVTYTKTGIVDR